MEASATDDAFSYVGLRMLFCEVDFAPTKSTKYTPFHEFGAPFWLLASTTLFVLWAMMCLGSARLKTHILFGFPIDLLNCRLVSSALARGWIDSF